MKRLLFLFPVFLFIACDPLPKDKPEQMESSSTRPLVERFDKPVTTAPASPSKESGERYFYERENASLMIIWQSETKIDVTLMISGNGKMEYRNERLSAKPGDSEIEENEQGEAVAVQEYDFQDDASRTIVSLKVGPDREFVLISDWTSNGVSLANNVTGVPIPGKKVSQ